MPRAARRPAPAVTDPLPGMRCRHRNDCRAVAKPDQDTLDQPIIAQHDSMVSRYAQHLALAHNVFNREQARSTAQSVVNAFVEDILTRRQEAAERRAAREAERQEQESESETPDFPADTAIYFDDLDREPAF